MKCYLHPDRNAVHSLNVPCAPGGKIHICAECKDDPNVLEKTFAKYRGEHETRIKFFKAPRNNPNN